MTVIDRKRIFSAGVWRKQYTIQCRRGHQYDVKEEYLKTGRLQTCKKCSHPPIVETDPEFAFWFADQDVPKFRTRYSHENADFYCQECGRVVKDKSIHTVYQRQYVPCPYCTNGISYPERYLMSVLTQMNVPFEHQYTVRFERAGRKSFFRYDFYDREKNLVIETHGAQHFLPGIFEYYGGYSLETIQKIDRQKAETAREVLKAEYVDLDCRKSEAAWIQKQIIEKLFFYPLEYVDWKQVEQDTKKSILMKIIALRKEGYTQKAIGEMLHLSTQAVSRKLKEAVREGLFDGITPRTIRIEENKIRIEEEKVEKRQRKEEREKRHRELLGQQERKEKQRMERIKKEEEYRKAVEEAAGMRLMEPYRKRSISLKLFCPVCQKAFSKMPDAILQDGTCPFCRRMEKIQKRIEELYGDDYEILGEYIDCHTPIAIKHKKCGTVFEKSLTKFWQHGCSVCSTRKRIGEQQKKKQKESMEKFQNLLPEIEEKGYFFIGTEPIWYGKKNDFRCRYCGEICRISPAYILKGHRHICQSHTRKKTHEEFCKQVERLAGDEYLVLSEYQNAHTTVKIRHRSCGLEYWETPAHFISEGRRCPVCSGGKDIMPERRNEKKMRYEKRQEIREGMQGFNADLFWKQRMEDAREFYEEYGNLDIPYGWMKNGYNLGSWISEQRKAYKKGKLEKNKVEELNACHIKWDYFEERWQQFYKKTKEFIKEYGTPSLSKNRTEEERSLYYWLQDQTKLMRHGRVQKEKVELLKELGLQTEYFSDVHFEQMCRKLEEFVKQHGHGIVSQKEGKGGEYPLGPWAKRMRQQMTSGKMSPERKERLMAIGLAVDNNEAKFQYKLKIISEYYRINGNLDIPLSYEEDGRKLGKWINRLRTEYRKNSLSKERIEALDQIGMRW